MQTTSSDIPVLVIQSMASDLWRTTAIPDISITIIDEVDPNTLQTIIRKNIRHHSVIIMEKEAFEECGSPLWSFIRRIRMEHGRGPRILVLRCKSIGKDYSSLAEGDRSAGANEVLWYKLCMSAETLTEKILRFIRNLPMENAGKQTATAPTGNRELPFSPKRPDRPKRAPLPRSPTKKPVRATSIPQSWLTWPFESRKSEAPAMRHSFGANTTATLTQLPNRRAKVTYCGVTIEFRESTAMMFLSLANTPGKVSQKELMKKHNLKRQPVYERVKRLRTDLEAYREGLGRCILTYNKGNDPSYSFDREEFCEVLAEVLAIE